MFFSKSVKRGHIRMLEKVKKIPGIGDFYDISCVYEGKLLH